jgi:tetrahydromethanopterin S-methyltransferase subunit G
MSETYVTQEEFKRLEARVLMVEHEVEGEKLLSRYTLSQSRQNGDDLAALKTRFDRIEEKVDRLEGKVDRLEVGLTTLRKELPAIVAEAVREVMRESRTR